MVRLRIKYKFRVFLIDSNPFYNNNNNNNAKANN